MIIDKHFSTGSKLEIHLIWKMATYILSQHVFPPQPAFTCAKSTIETLGKGVKYVQS